VGGWVLGSSRQMLVAGFEGGVLCGRAQGMAINRNTTKPAQKTYCPAGRNRHTAGLGPPLKPPTCPGEAAVSQMQQLRRWRAAPASTRQAWRVSRQGGSQGWLLELLGCAVYAVLCSAAGLKSALLLRPTQPPVPLPEASSVSRLPLLWTVCILSCRHRCDH